MSLLKLQRELAALLMEEPARRAFAEAPKRYAGKRLHGKDAQLLASLDPADVGYFASRRAIDRRGALAMDLPRTTALLEEHGRLLPYFRDHPYAIEDPLREVRRAARWCKAAARKGTIPALAADLAAYEAAHNVLRTKPHRHAAPSTRPRRAPGVVLLDLGHDISVALDEESPLEAPARPCFVLLHHGHDGIVAGEVPEVAWQVLRLANGRRTDEQLIAAAAKAAGVPRAKAARALAEGRREGVLAPVPRRP